MKHWTFRSDDLQKEFYTVLKDDGTRECSCPGFSSKGTCRHVRYIDQGIADKMSVAATGKIADKMEWVKATNYKSPWQKGWHQPSNVKKDAIDPPLLPFSILSPQLLTPINEESLKVYLENLNWGAQEKYNGKRIILDCRTNKVNAWNRKGKQCSIPLGVEVSARQSLVPTALGTTVGCIVDGELIGNHYIIYDLLVYCGKDIRSLSYKQRYTTLIGIGPLPHPSHQYGSLRVASLAKTGAEKKALFKKLKAEGREGIVLKNLNAPYVPGLNENQLKYKFYETISCLVIGHTPNKSSIKLGLFKLVKSGSKALTDVIFVGKCTVPQGTPIPAVGSVVEIRYLYAYKGGCLYQPCYLGERDDVNADSLEKVKYKSEDEADEPALKAAEDVEPWSDDTPKPKSIGPLKRRIQWK